MIVVVGLMVRIDVGVGTAEGINLKLPAYEAFYNFSGVSIRIKFPITEIGRLDLWDKWQAASQVKAFALSSRECRSDPNTEINIKEEIFTFSRLTDCGNI